MWTLLNVILIKYSYVNVIYDRFINYQNLNNKNSIYFKSKTTSEYEQVLLDYLKEGNNLIIKDRILCEYDLLISFQYLIYYVGKIYDIDVSKPSYSKEDMKLYFYKGSL